MVKRNCVLLIAIAALLGCGFWQEVKAQMPPDSCLVLIWKHEPEKGYLNPDSVLYDKCSCKGQNLLDRKDLWYAKKNFNSIFPFYCFKPKNDTLNVYTINDIDSNYAWVKEEFQKIKNKFGEFIISKYAAYIEDTSLPVSKNFYLHFDKYNRINEVEDFVIHNTIFFEHFQYTGKENIHLGNYVEDSQNTNSFFIYDISKKILFLELNKFSLQVRIIEIFNLSGSRVKTIYPEFELNRIEIDLSDWIHSLYFIRINNYVFKILI